MRRMRGRRSSRFRWACPRCSCGAANGARDPVRRLRLENGDVAVWGGPARFVYHGVAPLKEAEHPLTGRSAST